MESELTRLERLIRTHDLTFEYSDDHNSWERGRRQLDEILSIAKRHPKEATRLWKEKVDQTVREDFRIQFYRNF